MKKSHKLCITGIAVAAAAGIALAVTFVLNDAKKENVQEPQTAAISADAEQTAPAAADPAVTEEAESVPAEDAAEPAAEEQAAPEEGTEGETVPETADETAAYQGPFTDYFNQLLTYSTGDDANIDYVRCAVNIANDDSIGYGHSFPNTVSCAGIVCLTLTYCGYGDLVRDDPNGWGYMDIGTEFEDIMVNEVGAEVIEGPFGNTNYDQLQPGDIIYTYNSPDDNHTGIYIGNGKTVESRGPEYTTDADDNGDEVSVYDWEGSALTAAKIYRIPADKIHYLS